MFFCFFKNWSTFTVFFKTQGHIYLTQSGHTSVNLTNALYEPPATAKSGFFVKGRRDQMKNTF